MSEFSGLSPKQERVLGILLTEVTAEQTCKKAGISVATFWRYLRVPAFRAAYREARRQVTEDAISLLQRSSKKAVATLIRNLDSGSASVEISAAKSVLDYSLKGIELMELEARVRCSRIKNR